MTSTTTTTETASTRFTVGERGTVWARNPEALNHTLCQLEDGAYFCTRESGHRGQHAAAQRNGVVQHVWGEPEPEQPPLVRGHQVVLRDSTDTTGRVVRVAPATREVTVLTMSAWLGGSPRLITRPEEEWQRVGLPEVPPMDAEQLLARTVDALARPQGTAAEVADLQRRLDEAQATLRRLETTHEQFRQDVRDLAIRTAADQGWCDDGLNRGLRELGLDPKTREYEVEVEVTATQTVWVTVEAASEEHALGDVTEEMVENALLTRSGWTIDVWNTGGVSEA